jgi:hypothetical protein
VLLPFFFIWTRESSSSELGSLILSAPDSLSSIICFEEATLFSNSTTEPWKSSLSSKEIEGKARLEKAGAWLSNFSRRAAEDAVASFFAGLAASGLSSWSALMCTTILVGSSVALAAGAAAFFFIFFSAGL